MAGSNNAMTEIALALAMGFFSIMVVAMVSLGAGDGAAGAKARPEPLTVELIQADPSGDGRRAPDAEQAETVVVVYHGGRFLDAELAPIDPAGVRSGAGKRVILALPPDLPMAEALEARRAMTNAVPIVAALTPEWMTTLEETQHDR
jgi:hypothetical protein